MYIIKLKNKSPFVGDFKTILRLQSLLIEREDEILEVRDFISKRTVNPIFKKTKNQLNILKRYRLGDFSLISESEIKEFENLKEEEGVLLLNNAPVSIGNIYKVVTLENNVNIREDLFYSPNSILEKEIDLIVERLTVKSLIFNDKGKKLEIRNFKNEVIYSFKVDNLNNLVPQTILEIE
jgi:hypothetical protein